MSKIQKAFELVSPKKKIKVDAAVNLDGYKGLERIVINQLCNVKLAIFRYNTFENKDSGYKTFDREEDLLGVVDVRSIISMNPIFETKKAVESALKTILIA